MFSLGRKFFFAHFILYYLTHYIFDKSTSDKLIISFTKSKVWTKTILAGIAVLNGSHSFCIAFNIILDKTVCNSSSRSDNHCQPEPYSYFVHLKVISISARTTHCIWGFLTSNELITIDFQRFNVLLILSQFPAEMINICSINFLHVLANSTDHHYTQHWDDPSYL